MGSVVRGDRHDIWICIVDLARSAALGRRVYPETANRIDIVRRVPIKKHNISVMRGLGPQRTVRHEEITLGIVDSAGNSARPVDSLHPSLIVGIGRFAGIANQEIFSCAGRVVVGRENRVCRVVECRRIPWRVLGARYENPAGVRKRVEFVHRADVARIHPRGAGEIIVRVVVLVKKVILGRLTDNFTPTLVRPSRENRQIGRLLELVWRRACKRHKGLAGNGIPAGFCRSARNCEEFIRCILDRRINEARNDNFNLVAVYIGNRVPDVGPIVVCLRHNILRTAIIDRVVYPDLVPDQPDRIPCDRA